MLLSEIEPKLYSAIQESLYDTFAYRLGPDEWDIAEEDFRQNLLKNCAGFPEGIMKNAVKNRIKWLEREIKRLKKITDLSDLGKTFLSGRHERMANEQDFLIELLEEKSC